MNIHIMMTSTFVDLIACMGKLLFRFGDTDIFVTSTRILTTRDSIEIAAHLDILFFQTRYQQSYNWDQTEEWPEIQELVSLSDS